jgi:UDP-sulfoquinovose synthase
MQRILILGIDGYIGYPLALHLLSLGYEVCGADNYSRREVVRQAGGNSITPIAEASTRGNFLSSHKNFHDRIAYVTLSDTYIIDKVLEEYKPDTIVHLAEQPSAPWSMKNVRLSCDTQRENVVGTLSLLWAMRNHCPDAHLLKLGTMGEYGTPSCDIPEGMIPRECLIEREAYCPMSGLPFPRSPGSFYHLSKVHDTHNIIFACKTWNMRSTDIMQGVVFGVVDDYHTMPELLTRLDYDQYFGTAINRFCAQAAIGHPLTIYGTGHQIRGFLPLVDSLQCLTLAIENPPEFGEYRTFNQFEHIYKIKDLAATVQHFAHGHGLHAPIQLINNPRDELSVHHYNPAHQKLFDLGYEPSDPDAEIEKLLKVTTRYKDRINPDCIMPTTTWK